jgi:Tfp pilus assembly protein PilX
MNRSHQHGYILYTSVVLLIALMVFAVVAMKATTTDEVMARSYRNLGLATQAAEAQLVTAEASINPNDVTVEPVACETLNTEVWSQEQNEPAMLIQRIDLCEGNSSLAMGQSSTRQTDQMYRIVITDFDDPATRNAQVSLETIFIP